MSTTIHPSHPRAISRPTARAAMSGLLLALALAPASARAAENWVKPTPEELSMTSLPGYPGASAVVLFREQITKDDLHVVQHYDRIKILTEDGKKYANVELGYVSTTGAWDYSGDDKTISEISGRTIHPDGSIVPFTGKPYLKVLEKEKGFKIQQKIFSLPDVSVGSIIEYRYNTRIADNYYEAPDWIIQGDLYLKSAHYAWYPTSHDLIDEKERPINSISWFPILPPNAKIETHDTPGGMLQRAQRTYELSVHDVPPQTEEEFMPPIASYSYRVLFNFTAFRSADEFWKSQGKEWAKQANSFANPNSDLNEATQTVIAGATTQDEKLHKIYAAVMKLENTDFTREHDKREDKANGLAKLNNADDVWKNKRGNSTEITELFAGMARAAGMKADLMLVPDRSKNLFTPAWLNLSQFEGMIAIVNVDGTDKFFDPGSRYCAYGELAWQHTVVQGLRQKDGGTEFAMVASNSYKSNHISRVANLNMDDKGQLTGKIDLTFTGAPAVRWRQAALRGDDESLQRDLRTYLEEMIPHTLEVKTVSVRNLEDYDSPVAVSYTVAGSVGAWTGKRLLVPADLFLANAKATFPQTKRELGVYYHYPQYVQDALRINFVSGFSVEAVPSAGKFTMAPSAAYGMTVQAAPTSFTTRRDFAFNEVYILPTAYTELRSFYSQLESNDQGSVVLKTASATTASASVPGGK